MRGSPPRRRSVATVMPRAAKALHRYLTEVQPSYPAAGSSGALPRPRRVCLPPGRVDPHSAMTSRVSSRDR